MSKKKILICIPIHRYPELQTLNCVSQTIATSKHTIHYYHRTGDGLISRVRNELGRLFLEKDYDYLMWIDDDIIWTIKDKLIDLLVSRKKDIICGVYPVRDGTGRPAIRTKEIQKLHLAKKYKGQKVKVPKDKVFEIVYGSTGFMLITKKCVEDVYKHYPFPFQPIYPNGEYLSEDWAFCERAKSLKYKTWADTTFELGHLGTTTFTLQNSNYKK